MKNLLFTLFLMACLTTNSYAQWTLEYLSSPRAQLQSAKFGNEIYFIAGNSTAMCSTVDVYNTVTEVWMPATNISVPRCFPAAVGGDSALYVAGGLVAFTTLNFGSNIVDIYKNGTWSTHILPDSIWLAQAVHVGNKILIGGGLKSFNSGTGVPVVSDLLDVYDELTNTWDTDTLSEPRTETAVATDGVIAIFAGGLKGANQVSNVVDIYNSSTNTWTTDTLSEARTLAAGIYAGGKFYFAGGAKPDVSNSSDVVDIFDGTNWTTAHLSSPRAGSRACTAGDKVFFAGGGDMDLPNLSSVSSSDLVDVYDITSALWTTSNMNYEKINHTAIGAGNKVYVAGGYEISSGTLLDAVEVWDITYGIHSLEHFNEISAYPNPAVDFLTISLTGKSSKTEIRIINLIGEVVLHSSLTKQKSVIDISSLSDGVYLIELAAGENISRQKFIKQ
jgi:hypothetical protein